MLFFPVSGLEPVSEPVQPPSLLAGSAGGKDREQARRRHGESIGEVDGYNSAKETAVFDNAEVRATQRE
jgi:hypothetical protein